jgi:hypothetical protein
MPIAHIIATYSTYSHFKIPKSLRDFLLSREECDSLPPNSTKPGYWYIYWDTLHYYDVNGEEQQIESCGEDTEYKHPTEMEISDEPVFNESDTEEESEDTEESDDDL